MAMNDEELLGEAPEELDNEAFQSANKYQTVIVVAGKPRSGKSRALNNLFHVDFQSRCSASSVTSGISSQRVLRDGRELILVDTPGIGAPDVPIRGLKREFEQIVGGLNYTLVLCHSVGPNNMFSDRDTTVLKDLQKMCGSKIWKNCVILFTFSDTLRDQEFPHVTDRDGYVNALQEHAKQLSQMLRVACGSHVPEIKLVLDVDVQCDNIEEIVAVPVGIAYKDKKEKHIILPDHRNGVDWTNRAYVEVLRKSKPLDRVKLLTAKHFATTASSASIGAGIGSLIGGFTGSAVGLLAGGIGAIPGAVVGAVAGAVAGAVGGTGSGHFVMQKITRVKEKKAKRLGMGDLQFSLPCQQHKILPLQEKASRQQQWLTTSLPLLTPEQADAVTSQISSDSGGQIYPSRNFTARPRLLQGTSDPTLFSQNL